MIIFTVLIIALIVVVAITTLVFTIAGGLSLIVFGDLIVCIVILWAIIRHLVNKNRKKD